MKLKGKSAMVWQLRMWRNGDPSAQVAEARSLGLKSVSIKVVDGFRRRWETGGTTNADLLPALVPMLRAADIEVLFWGWLWGRKLLRKFPGSAYAWNFPAKEAHAAIEACRFFGVNHFDVNAEAPYRGHPEYAQEYCNVLANEGPDIDYTMCSYRYPITHQPDFPIGIFAPYMDGWSPQVYFLQDNRPDAGAIQLTESKRQYAFIRNIDYCPVAPTYPSTYKDSAGNKQVWTASKSQLTALFKKAEGLGCEAISIWDLPQATEAQKQALAAFNFAVTPAPIPPLPPTPPVEKFWLAWPVPVPKIVTQRYGINPQWYRPFGLKGHEGIDMRAPNATPVFAMADGQVVRVEPTAASGPYGVQVRVEHKHAGEIYETVYAHFTVGSIAVALGQKVERGEKLGLADNTGNSSGAHLHMTLKHRGHGSPWMNKSEIVDPTPYLPDIFPGKGWIIDIDSNFRTEPRSDAPVIRLLRPNTVFEAIEGALGDGDWWKVRVAGVTGYIWQPGYKARPV